MKLVRKILIIDDEDEIRELYKQFVQRDMGEQDIIFAKDGVEGFMQTSIQKFDLITLDHKMPRLNGLDLLMAIRSQPGLNHNTPIIVISSFLPKPTELISTIENTFFLIKPIDSKKLSECFKLALAIE